MRPEPSSETRLIWKLKDIMHQHGNFAQAVIGNLGLHFGQPRILFTIRDLEGASQKEIAARLQVTAASLAVSLKRLQKGGFLERRTDSADQRVNLIVLTAKGLEAIETCHRQMQQIDRQMMSGFSDQEKEQLTAYLLRIKENLDACRLEGNSTLDPHSHEQFHDRSHGLKHSPDNKSR